MGTRRKGERGKMKCCLCDKEGGIRLKGVDSRNRDIVIHPKCLQKARK